jgi:hypothetical protein
MAFKDKNSVPGRMTGGFSMFSKSGVMTLVSLALATFLQGTAQAGTYLYSDGFEGSDRSTTWSFGGEGSGAIIKSSVAFSGSYFARLTAGSGQWNGVGRNVWAPAHPGGYWYGPVYCNVGFWVRPHTNTQVNVEVINPYNWTYHSLKTHTLSASTNWTLLHANGWYSHGSYVHVRLSIVGTGSRTASVDNMTLTCSWPQGD